MINPQDIINQNKNFQQSQKNSYLKAIWIFYNLADVFVAKRATAIVDNYLGKNAGVSTKDIQNGLLMLKMR